MASNAYPVNTKERNFSDKSSLGTVIGHAGNPSHGSVNSQADPCFYTSPSIRQIKKNIVKARAEVFEKKDDIRHSESVSPKSLASGCVGLGRMRAAKSTGNICSVGTDTGPGYDGRTYMLAARGSAVETGLLAAPTPRLMRNVSSDIVSKRLSMFENLQSRSDVDSFKPAIRPKPSVISIGPVSRSVSSEYVTETNANESVSSDFNKVTPSVCAASPRLASPSPRRSRAANPSSPVTVSRHVSQSTLSSQNSVAESPNCSSRNTVASPIAFRPVTGSSSVLPVPPPKPARASADVNQNKCDLLSPNVYGLLVYAASTSPPNQEVTVHVENISPNSVFASPVSPLSAEAVRPVPAVRRLPSQEMCSFGVKSPAVSNRVSVQPRGPISPNPPPTPASRSKISDSWEQKFIRAPKEVISVHKKADKGHFVKKAKMNNPSYMYVDDLNMNRTNEGRPLTRHHSDDMLNVPQNKHKEPIYEVPDVDRQQDLHSKIVFDTAGYALPLIDKPPEIPPKDRLYAKQGISQAEMRNIQAKVSSAYSILRLPFIAADGESSSVTGSIEDRDSDAEIDLEEHRKRLRHVSRVKEATNKDVLNYEKVRLMKGDHRLFEFAMIVGLQEDESGLGCKPMISFSFPTELSEFDKLASHFCFPEADDWQPVPAYNGETFSFLLTNAEGGRKYGWCCRYLPPGNGRRLPEAICIVSHIGEMNLYNQLLDIAKECRFKATAMAEEMLQVAYARAFPQPNHEVYIRAVDPDFVKKTFVVKREAESRYNNVSFSGLLSHLPVDIILQVFATILLERKLILCSSELSTLSSCMSTVVALLYPFEWQHTFITVLPSMLIDVVDAPTPYIIGILASMKVLLDDHSLHEVFIVDLDVGKLISSVGDESRIVPKKIQKAICAAIDYSDSQVSSPCATVHSFQDSDEIIAEAFLRMFVETCGHYDTYITTQQDGEKFFQRELFVKAVSSHSIHLFLEWFTMTQMFDVFITDRLKADFADGVFEKRVKEYRDEMDKLSGSVRDNMKVVGKKIVGFFRDYGGRLKKSFQKNVFV